MKRFFLIAALAAACSACAPKEPAVIDSGTAFAYDALLPYVESGELPGAVNIFYHDGIQETCCVGYADVEAKRPITVNDVYMQCSQTKGFCGVTAAKLVEQGLLSLDDPVSKYLPEFATLWVLDGEENGVRTLHKAQNELTVRMCLNHMGGFPFESCIKSRDIPGGGWSGGATLRINAAAAAACPIMFEPGTRASYSNTGIDIAAAVVEVITGMAWEDYLKKEVLDPLGMTSSSFRPTDRQLENKIEMYYTEEGKQAAWVEQDNWQQRPYNDSHVYASAGAGLWTTAADQLKFYKMLMNLGVGENGVRILEEDTVKNLLAVSSRPDFLGEREDDSYSLGLWAPKVDSEERWFGHGGAWNTHCEVNWHTRSLKLWAVQLLGSYHPWEPALQKAAEDFFATVVNTDNSYVGRTEE